MVDFCGRVEEAFQEDPEADSVMVLVVVVRLQGSYVHIIDRAMCVPRAPVLISLLPSAGQCASYEDSGLQSNDIACV